MRAIKPDEPKNPLNQGVVVFHAGSNIAERWSDFRTYNTIDQQYFQELLPLEEFDFASGEEILVEQGTGLSLHHAYYPHVTSRDTTAA